jgi:hypothetical protein
MKQFLARNIVKVINWARNKVDEPGMVTIGSLKADAMPDMGTSLRGMPKTINFSVNPADGGFVVELRRYDQRKGDDDRKLYIVGEDKNLGEELGKIITAETLRY